MYPGGFKESPTNVIKDAQGGALLTKQEDILKDGQNMQSICSLIMEQRIHL